MKLLNSLREFKGKKRLYPALFLVICVLFSPNYPPSHWLIATLVSRCTGTGRAGQAHRHFITHSHTHPLTHSLTYDKGFLVGYTSYSRTSAKSAGEPNQAEVWLKNAGLVSDSFSFSLNFDVGPLHVHLHHWLYLLIINFIVFLSKDAGFFRKHMSIYWAIISLCFGGACQGLIYDDWKNCFRWRVS